MTPERSFLIHARTCLVSVLAVPVLYFLSVPIVWYLAMWARTRSRISDWEWLEYFVAPYTWLYDTPLKEVAVIYWNWWQDVYSRIM
jgi:hypothetical protein